MSIGHDSYDNSPPKNGGLPNGRNVRGKTSLSTLCAKDPILLKYEGKCLLECNVALAHPSKPSSMLESYLGKA